MAGKRLQQWLDDEQAVLETCRKRARQGPLLNWQDFADRPAMEYLQAIRNGDVAAPAMYPTLDILLMHVEPGKTIFQGKPGPKHLNPMGSVHGGWYCTLLDSALGMAVHTEVAVGFHFTTLELKVNMIRPIHEGLSRVRATGEVVHVGRKTGVAQGTLYDADDKILGHASTTCLIYQAT